MRGDHRTELTFVHIKTSKEFKQRKEVLSKALIRETMEQLSGSSTIQQVWVSENGREALVRFSYKDSARRVVLATNREQSLLNDLKCTLATPDVIKTFQAATEGGDGGIIRNLKRQFGIAEGTRFRDGSYGLGTASLPTLSDLEERVR